MPGLPGIRHCVASEADSCLRVREVRRWQDLPSRTPIRGRNTVKRKDFVLDTHGLQAIIDGHYSFQILYAAVHLNLFTILKKGLTRKEIMAELHLSEVPARILLLGCVSLGLIQKEGNRYCCSEVAELTLTDGSAFDQRALVEFGHQISYRPMWWFCDALKQNTNVGLREFQGESSTLYGRLALDPLAERTFHDMMSTVSKTVAERFSGTVELSTGGQLVDVGGGAAINAIAIARRWPALQISIFDLPSVVACADERVETAGLQERIYSVAGDCFLDQFPPCDHMLFAHFLEIWSEEQIRALLTKAHNSLVSGGHIYLINVFQDDDERGPFTAASVSAYLLTVASGVGMVHTWSEYEHLLSDSGFEPLRRTALTPSHGLIIGKRVA
jgi:O-methyltransferase domain/Dimerisation domain